ncbi:hypothetical protein HZA38_01060 [Candidatus Peregrinibacteria bacterium]|nr:hypothetical protein [Candidatus Peregrinibacteria bacterium]
MSRYLSPKLVIAEAWEITREYKKELFWYGFIPAFFGVIVGTVYISYQIVSFRHFFLGDQDQIQYFQIFQNVWDYLKSGNAPLGFIIAGVIIVLLGYIFSPVLCTGSLIFLIERIKKGEPPEKGVPAGLFSFLYIFEYGAIKNAVSPKTFITESSFMLRNLKTGFFVLISPLLGFFMILGIIALFLFAYVPQSIVLQKRGLMPSIGKSTRLSCTYFTETLGLFLLFLLIELRILLNIVIILVLPFVVIGITGLFSSTLLSGVGITITLIVGLVLITITAMISGTLEIFSTAIWTIAFHTLTGDEEKQTEL